MVHDDYKEMIPAQALSALDAREARELKEHLANCAECRRDLAEWEATAASLALSADPVEPSPEIRARILRSASSVVPLKRSERIVSRQRFTAIAAVILLAALLVVVLILWQQNRSLRQQNEFAQLLTAPGSKVAQLSGTNEAKIATAKLAYAQNGRAILIADGLPLPPAGKEYQLWFIVNNKPLPGKTFAPDNRGHGQIHDLVPEAARNSAIFAITLEPAGGVSAPTGAIYLRGEL